MKRAVLSAVLVALGASAWWLLARTARFSIQKWDAKFETVLRHSLDNFGLTNADVLSSVHEVRKDAGGEWIVHRMKVRLPDDERRRRLEGQLREAGGDVSLKPGAEEAVLSVRRGGRLYQEILLAR